MYTYVYIYIYIYIYIYTYIYIYIYIYAYIYIYIYCSRDPRQSAVRQSWRGAEVVRNGGNGTRRGDRSTMIHETHRNGEFSGRSQIEACRKYDT